MARIGNAAATLHKRSYIFQISIDHQRLLSNFLSRPLSGNIQKFPHQLRNSKRFCDISRSFHLFPISIVSSFGTGYPDISRWATAKGHSQKERLNKAMRYLTCFIPLEWLYTFATECSGGVGFNLSHPLCSMLELISRTFQDVMKP